MKKFLRVSLYVIILLFAVFGFGLTLVFIAQKTGLTNDRGAVDKNDRIFKELAEEKNHNEILLPTSAIDSLLEANTEFTELFYKIHFINKYFPRNAGLILNTYRNTKDIKIVESMIKALSIYINIDSLINLPERHDHKVYSDSLAQKWMNSNEWGVLKEALVKEKEFVRKAAIATGVEPRMIICCVIGEQMRIYNQARERFKQLFAPVKTLSFMTNLSYGVAGVKEGTALLTRHHLKDTSSVFYLGKKYENLLDFKEDSQDVISRLTNYNDHYYTYVYVGLILKQIKTQWERTTYPISERPEILSTIYNLGFGASTPKPDPQAGGSTFFVDGIEYSFGTVTFDFYYSGELADEFPFWENKWTEPATEEQTDSLSSL